MRVRPIPVEDPSGYVSTLSHDKAPREQEAEKGSKVFESFRDFVKSKF